jgi:hypothetical protein
MSELRLLLALAPRYVCQDPSVRLPEEIVLLVMAWLARIEVWDFPELAVLTPSGYARIHASDH